MEGWMGHTKRPQCFQLFGYYYKPLGPGTCFEPTILFLFVLLSVLILSGLIPTPLTSGAKESWKATWKERWLSTRPRRGDRDGSWQWWAQAFSKLLPCIKGLVAVSPLNEDFLLCLLGSAKYQVSRIQDGIRMSNWPVSESQLCSSRFLSERWGSCLFLACGAVMMI